MAAGGDSGGPGGPAEVSGAQGVQVGARNKQVNYYIQNYVEGAAASGRCRCRLCWWRGGAAAGTGVPAPH